MFRLMRSRNRRVSIKIGNASINNALLCATGMQRMLGLMFRRPQCAVLEFKKPALCSVHMIFVFFKLDILWVDENLKLVHFKKNLIPFASFGFSSKKAQYIIEIPSSIRKKHKLTYSTGQSISIF